MLRALTPTRIVLGALAATAVAVGSVMALERDDGGDTPAGGEARTVTAAQSSRAPEPETTLALDAPPRAQPVIWVRKGRGVVIRTEPGGGEVAARAGKRTPFGSPTVFAVARTEGDWAAVSTAELPNGELGWVRLDPRNLEAGWTKASIVVDLSDRRAALIEDGEVVRSFAVTIGMPGADTPTGTFAVTDTFRGELDPAYGCCAVAISATQPNLPSGWLGGRRIAIHGTDGPLGVAASHGCVRAADSDVSALVRRVPLGTPVTIRA